MTGIKKVRAKFLLQTLGIVLSVPLVVYCVAWALLRLGMSPSVYPWAEPDLWVPEVIPPFPWVDFIAYLLALVTVPLLLDRSVAGSARQQAGLRRPGGRHPVLIMLAVTAGLIAYQRLACRGLGEMQPSLLSLKNFAYFVALWGWIAFSEEFFFRSILQRRLTSLWGNWAAIGVTAILFSFGMHHRVPIVQNAVYRLPAAITLGWLFARQRSLLSPVAAHFLLNLASFA